MSFMASDILNIPNVVEICEIRANIPMFPYSITKSLSNSMGEHFLKDRSECVNFSR